jgi:hypothetical protein
MTARSENVIWVVMRASFAIQDIPAAIAASAAVFQNGERFHAVNEGKKRDSA